MQDVMQSRRTFIKAASVALGGMAVAGLAGCAPAATAANDEASSVDGITWDEEFDIVVVGGGLAGMAAAVTAATEGDGASCLLLEKGPQETGNGNSAFAAGMVLWTNQRDNFLEYLKELRGEMDNTPDDVLASFADGVSENLDWLRSLPGFSEDEVTITEYYAEGTGDSCYPEHNELEHAYSIGRIRWNPSNESGNTQVTLFMNSSRSSS